MIVKYLSTGHWYLLGEEDNNPLIGTGLPLQNTTATICSTSPELCHYSNPDLTSDLTYRPNTTPTPKNPSIRTGNVKPKFKGLASF
jgi:hypothetical protein